MIFISESKILELLEWEGLVNAITSALREISETNSLAVPSRTIINVEKTPLSLYTMPAYSSTSNVVSCKLVTQCPENAKRFGLPSIAASIILFNADNGQMEAILDGTMLTEWRTAAGSIVATKYLLNPNKLDFSKMTLSVLGSGQQGKIHLLGFQNYFKFGKLKLWNRTLSKANIVANELMEKHKLNISVCNDIKECVIDADIIIWCGSATSDIYLTSQDIKSGTLIISVGTSPNMPSGLGEDIFQNAQLLTESRFSAKSEMKHFIEKNNFEFSEIGEIILGRKYAIKDSKHFIVYQSLGSGMMDAAAGKYIFEKFKNSDENKNK